MKAFAIVVFWVFHLTRSDDDIVTQLPDGKVRGKLEQSRNGTDYYAYYQIPFAAPPVGERRFKEPQDPIPWDDILDATESTKQCPQSTTHSRALSATDDEDCLYLSVNTPVKPGEKGDLPVILWIHGGGFTTGSISIYGPQFLMDYGIIVVQVQYRLGPFGFMTTGDGVIPANLGLKDQRKAINWVHENIQYFGGDPHKVTLLGESAGAMSIGYLLLDLSLEGKFRAAIQQSGSSASRLVRFKHDPKTFAFQLGHQLDDSFGEHNSTEELLDLVKNSSTEDILTASLMVTAAVGLEHSSAGLYNDGAFGIAMENVEFENDPVVTAPVLKSFQEGNFVKVPTILGFNSEEALISGLSATDDMKARAAQYDKDPSLMGDERVPTNDDTAFGAEQIKILTNTSFEDDYGAFVRYTSNIVFVNGILAQASYSSAHTPVYVYEFSYSGQKLGLIMYIAYGMMTKNSIPGAQTVAHGEDIGYLWNSTYFMSNDAPEEHVIRSNQLLKLIINFAKYLDATPEKDEELDSISWPRVKSGTEIEYLNLNETLTIESNPRNFKQLSEIYEKYAGVSDVW